MDAATQTCENCRHYGLELYIKGPGRYQRLLKCPQCDLYQKGIKPHPYIYGEAYHIEYAKRLVSKTRTAKTRLGGVVPYLDTTHPRLLDIGSSVGATVRAAEQLGWRATGVDVSKAAVELSRNDGLDCHTIDGKTLPFDDKTFDVVTHWHVLEHVEDVFAALQEWARVLKPGGLMVMETPNSRYLKARIMGPRYEKFWPSAHLYGFNYDNLSQIVEQVGFEVLPTRLIGTWRTQSPAFNTFALFYRVYRHSCRALDLCKSLELVCRKRTTGTTSSSLRRAA